MGKGVTLSSAMKSHEKLVDNVVYDALAYNSAWINHCIKHGAKVIVRAKNNKNNRVR